MTTQQVTKGIVYDPEQTKRVLELIRQDGYEASLVFKKTESVTESVNQMIAAKKASQSKTAEPKADQKTDDAADNQKAEEPMADEVEILHPAEVPLPQATTQVAAATNEETDDRAAWPVPYVVVTGMLFVVAGLGMSLTGDRIGLIFASVTLGVAAAIPSLIGYIAQKSANSEDLGQDSSSYRGLAAPSVWPVILSSIAGVLGVLIGTISGTWSIEILKTLNAERLAWWICLIIVVVSVIVGIVVSRSTGEGRWAIAILTGGFTLTLGLTLSSIGWFGHLAGLIVAIVATVGLIGAFAYQHKTRFYTLLVLPALMLTMIGLTQNQSYIATSENYKPASPSTVEVNQKLAEQSCLDNPEAFATCEP